MTYETLEEHVWEICNQLVAKRKLVTQANIIDCLQASDHAYPMAELERWVPKYLKAWRLANLSLQHLNAFQQTEGATTLPPAKPDNQHAARTIRYLRARNRALELQRKELIGKLKRLLGSTS